MEKLKKVFSPGHDKDDEILYGDPASKGSTGAESGSAPESNPPQLETAPEADKKSHSIGRQLFNPGGEKYSEQSYGQTATAKEDEQPSAEPSSTTISKETEQLSATPIAQEDEQPHEGPVDSATATEDDQHGVEPGTAAIATEGEPNVGEPNNTAGIAEEDKQRSEELESTPAATEDKQRSEEFESTPAATEDKQRSVEPAVAAAATKDEEAEAAPEEEKKKSGGFLSKLFSRSDKEPKKKEEETAAAAPEKQTSKDTSQAVPGAETSTTEAPSSSSAQALPDRTAQETSGDDSHFERDAAIAGVGATGVAGAGAYAYESRDDKNKPQEDEQTPTNEGTFGTNEMESRPADNPVDDPSQATYTYSSTKLASGSAPEHPSTTEAPQSDLPHHIGPTPVEREHRDTSLEGAGTKIGAGTVGEDDLASQEDKHNDPEVEQATYTVRSYPVGGGTDQAATERLYDANQEPMDPKTNPHVPGEFPAEDGSDPHNVPGEIPAESGEKGSQLDSGTAAAAGAGAGAGAGAAGLAGYEATKSKDEPTTTESSAHPGGEGFPIMTTTNSVSHASPTEQPSEESHTGRDAAIAGAGAAGAGALGYGAYEVTKDRDDPQQATQPTQVEPASQPTQSESISKPKDTTTTTKDTTKPTSAEPTKPEPAKSEEVPPQKDDDSHLGRDAAIAGGAGAAGVGAYELSKDEEEKEHEKQLKAAEKEHEKQEKEAAKEHEKREKEAAKEQKKHEKEVAKEQKAEEKAQAKEEKKEEKEHKKQIAAAEKKQKEQEKEAEKDQKEEEKKRADAAALAEKERKDEEQKRAEAAAAAEKEKEKEPEEDEHHYGRDAAIGGGTAVAGAAGYEAYEHGKEPEDNRVFQDSQGHHKLHKKAVEQTEPEEKEKEKKPNLIQKILHPHKSKQKEEELKRQSMDEPTDLQEAQQKSRHVDTDGAIGDDNRVSNPESREPEGIAQAKQQSQHVGVDGAIGDDHHAGHMDHGAYTTGEDVHGQHTQQDSAGPSTSPGGLASQLPTDEHGNIVLVNRDAPEGAPHVHIGKPGTGPV